MKRRTFVRSTLGLTALVCFSSLAQAQSPQTLTLLTPTTLSLAFAPELYADVAGKFKNNGIQIKIEIGRAAAQAIQLVAANQVQIGRTGGGAYLSARSQGNSDVIAIGTIAQISPFTLVSAKTAPLAKPADIAGKTIGLPSFGGTAESSFNLMLVKDKVDPSSIRRERVAYSPATFGLIEAGRLDGFFANTSTVARMKAENMPAHFMEIDDGIPGNVYVAREANLERSPEPYIAFLKSVREAAQALASMDDAALAEALELIKSKYDVPGLDRMDVALLDIKATRSLWTIHGVENAARNDEKQWSEAQRTLEETNAIQKSQRPMYTNDFWARGAQ